MSSVPHLTCVEAVIKNGLHALDRTMSLEPRNDSELDNFDYVLPILMHTFIHSSLDMQADRASKCVQDYMHEAELVPYNASGCEPKRKLVTTSQQCRFESSTSYLLVRSEVAVHTKHLAQSSWPCAVVLSIAILPTIAQLSQATKVHSTHYHSSDDR